MTPTTLGDLNLSLVLGAIGSALGTGVAGMAHPGQTVEPLTNGRDDPEPPEGEPGNECRSAGIHRPVP